jgi:hypothetical protein
MKKSRDIDIRPNYGFGMFSHQAVEVWAPAIGFVLGFVLCFLVLCF